MDKICIFLAESWWAEVSRHVFWSVAKIIFKDLICLIMASQTIITGSLTWCYKFFLFQAVFDVSKTCSNITTVQPSNPLLIFNVEFASWVLVGSNLVGNDGSLIQTNRLQKDLGFPSKTKLWSDTKTVIKAWARPHSWTEVLSGQVSHSPLPSLISPSIFLKWSSSLPPQSQALL